MLNRVILMGRITQDLEIRQTQGGVAVLSFTVAVDRGYVKQGEERQTDFINCVAWRQQAEFISRYFAKGRMIAIEGNLRTRTYDDKNGVKHYITEISVASAFFAGEQRPSGSNGAPTAAHAQLPQSAQHVQRPNMIDLPQIATNYEALNKLKPKQRQKALDAFFC